MSFTTQPTRPTRRQVMLQLAGGGAAFWGASASVAQTAAWPSAKPIRMVVNFPAGGSPDAVARAVGPHLSAALGQQVVVDNRGGAGGIIGSDIVAKSVGDGYTFLLSSGSGMSIVPLITPKMPFDWTKDLLPVAGGARLELFLVVRSDAPYKTYPEFISYLKRNPGKLSYGSPGNGTSPHVAAEMFKSQTGTFAVHIPYRGSSLALQDLLAGNLDFAFDPGIAFSHVRAGKLRLLAVGSAKRIAMFPDTPTLIELGLAGFDVGTTHGFWAPAGTPPAVVDRLNNEINKALAMPDVVTVIRNLGAEPHVLTPAQFAGVINADAQRFGKVIRERRISAD